MTFDPTNRRHVLRELRNAKRRFDYWNQGCKRTGAKAHEKLELYRADIDRLKQYLHDLRPH